MAETPEGEEADTTSHESEQTTTGNMSAANDSVVEIADDKITNSIGGTSRPSSGEVEIVSDGTNKTTRMESPTSSSVLEVVDEVSKKRKATDEDETTPSKKQKRLPPDGAGKKTAGDVVRYGDGDTQNKTAALPCHKEIQKDLVDESQASGQKQALQYNSIEECRAKANKLLHERKAEIIDLKAQLGDLENEKDSWQRRAWKSEGKLQNAEKAQAAEEKILWNKALDWKKREMEKQDKQAKQKYLKELEKAKTSMQKKLETLQTKLEKEQDKVEELTGIKADQRREIQDLKKEIKECKPGDSKALKEKCKELEASQNLLEAQKTQNHVLTNCLENRTDDLARVREERAAITRKAQSFHKEWEEQVKFDDQLKVEHQDDLLKQYDMWNVQANNSRENQLRLVGRQRGLFELNNAHDRACHERDHLKKQLKVAFAEIERLKASAAPQPPRPAAVSSTPSDLFRIDRSRLQEPQPQRPFPKVNKAAESNTAAAPPDPEVTPRSSALGSRAKPEDNATTDSGRQVTQIVNGVMHDGAQQPQAVPHSATLASNSGTEADEAVELDPAMQGAAEVLSQDMQTAREDAGDVEEDEAFAEPVEDELQDVPAAAQEDRGEGAGRAEGNGESSVYEQMERGMESLGAGMRGPDMFSMPNFWRSDGR